MSDPAENQDASAPARDPDVAEQFTCFLCAETLEDPVVCPCGCPNRCCRACLLLCFSCGRGECPFTKIAISSADQLHLESDTALAAAIEAQPSECVFGCGFSATTSACVAHERSCTRRRSIRPGYYLLYRCQASAPFTVLRRVPSNDMLLSFPDPTNHNLFMCEQVLGIPWEAQGTLRRDGSMGFYMWITDTEYSYTTVRILPNGDIIGNVRGNSAHSRWTYRAKFIEPPE